VPHFNPTERKSNQVIVILAGVFVDGKYIEGWNDRRVAAEAKVTRMFVAEVRQWRLKPVFVRASGSPRAA
jgi:hypothetical protein